jgi:transcriptional regulator NrdR family protein
MQCKGCAYLLSHVVRVMHDDKNETITRRRECLKCGARFTTTEKYKEYKRANDNRYQGTVK